MRKSLLKASLALAGNRRFDFFEEIRHIPRRSPEEIAALQLEKLRAVLVHARDHAPFYRERFKAASFDPERVQQVSDLQALPTLTRDDVRANLDAIVSDNFDRARLQKWSTGGSTGEPVSLYKEKDCVEMEMALMWRSWSWAGWSPGEKMVWIWGAPQETSELNSLAGKIKWWLGGRLLLDAFDMGDKNLAEWVEKINRFGAEHVIGYATSLTTFAQFLLANNVKLKPNIRQVISTAEKLFPEQREIIQHGFQAPVKDQYGSREIRVTAFEGPKGDMHVISDSCVMEFVPDPNVQDDSFRIVCTNLNNFAMPLIRYEVGDYGAPKNDAAGDGIGFPLMDLQIGRVTDNFIMSNGRVVHGEYYTHLMYGIDGVRQFQFRQDRPNRIRLIVVPEPGVNPSDLDRKLEFVRRESLGLDSSVEMPIEYQDTIPLTRSGKFLFTVCELDRTTAV